MQSLTSLGKPFTFTHILPEPHSAFVSQKRWHLPSDAQNASLTQPVLLALAVQLAPMPAPPVARHSNVLDGVGTHCWLEPQPPVLGWQAVVPPMLVALATRQSVTSRCDGVQLSVLHWHTVPGPRQQCAKLRLSHASPSSAPTVLSKVVQVHCCDVVPR